jgi:hypothetical protein
VRGDSQEVDVNPRSPIKRIAFVIRLALTPALAVNAGGCRPPPVAPPPPTYTPSYVYVATPSAAKQDVTIAVIAPIVKGNVYGSDGAEMLKGLPTALVDLITAKGMRYRGPFETLDIMTFPEKREADLGLYAELQVDAGWAPQNVTQDVNVSAWNGQTTVTFTCDASVFARGKASFVLIEPMSGETVWRKTVPVELAPTLIRGLHDNRACAGPGASQQQIAAFAAMTGQAPPQPAAPPLEGEFGNAFRRQLELSFVAIMKGIDRYMSAEEFALLKTQAAELKAKKAY